MEQTFAALQIAEQQLRCCALQSAIRKHCDDILHQEYVAFVALAEDNALELSDKHGVEWFIAAHGTSSMEDRTCTQALELFANTYYIASLFAVRVLARLPEACADVQNCPRESDYDTPEFTIVEPLISQTLARWQQSNSAWTIDAIEKLCTIVGHHNWQPTVIDYLRERW